MTQKMMFFILVIFSIIISISSNSFLSIWISLEMNLIAVVPIFSMPVVKKIESSIMIYFLIQTISSIMFLYSILSMNIYPFMKSIFLFMLMLSIMMKMGLFPFHFWIPPVMEGMTWLNCFILSTIQKIIPLMILFFIYPQKMIIMFCVFNSLITSMMGLNQFSLRKIMSFSSMNHLSFLIMTTLLSKKLFKMYFILYTFMSFLTFNFFHKINLNYLFQTFFFLKMTKIMHFNLMILILNMAGTPPLAGFFPKMMIVLKMMEFNMFLPATFMLLSNVLTTFFLLTINF